MEDNDFNTDRDRDSSIYNSSIHDSLKRKRFFSFLTILIILCVLIIIKYGILMLGPTPVQRNTTRITADRGQIQDRNGKILAIQTRLGNISAWRPGIKNIDNLVNHLSPLLQINQSELKSHIQNSASDFVYLKKQVDRITVIEIEKLLDEKLIEGITIEPVMGRIYPEKQLAAQIIGFVGDENTGLAGIEYAFDNELKAKSNASDADSHGALAGNHIVLSLDAGVQYILEEKAQEALIKNEAEAVMLLAMNPRTGDILGSASLPGFDPNKFGESPDKNRMNRPAIWQYEPGSVFKVFSLASFLDTGAINSAMVFNCNGKYEHLSSSGERIVITCLGAHGPVTARDIIIYSCNAGTAYASDRSSARNFYDSIRALGFGDKTASLLPGETPGFLRSTERWSDRSKPTIAMGQEIAVSALQMMQAVSAIANDGITVSPRIVLRITDYNGKTVREVPQGERKRVFKAETAAQMRRYMEAVTLSGTGTRAVIGDMPLAVKTGTAQLVNPGTNRYSDTDFIASCIAMLPSDNPALIIYGVIIKPKGASYLGGRIAAPLIRESAEELVNYLGIPRGRNPQVRHSGRVSLPHSNIPIVGDYVPDLSGFSKRSLMPLLLREDLHIEINGDGWVKSQRPAPGTPINSSTVIVLNLE